MDVHGESIYDTVAGPYDKPLPWGCITQKATGSQSTRLYLHVFKWPASGELVLPGMLNTSGRASLMLPDGQQPTELAVHSSGEDLIVRLPAEPTNPHETPSSFSISPNPPMSARRPRSLRTRTSSSRHSRSTLRPAAPRSSFATRPTTDLNRISSPACDRHARHPHQRDNDGPCSQLHAANVQSAPSQREPSPGLSPSPLQSKASSSA
jgi:hypothetical protein